MKQKTLILLFVPFMLWACKNDDNPCNEPNYMETSLTQIQGELTIDYGENILQDENTLYGITVRLENRKTYAYGLFDDLSKAIVRRDANRQYWANTTVVPYGKQRCSHDENGNYGDLFTIHGNGKIENCPVTNEFIYCDTTMEVNGFRESLLPISSYPYDIYVSHDALAYKEKEHTFTTFKYNGYIRFFAYNLSRGRFEIQMNEMDKQFSLTPEEQESILPFTIILKVIPFPTWLCEDYSSEATFQVRHIDEERQIDRWMDKSVIVHRDELNICLLDVNEFTN